MENVSPRRIDSTVAPFAALVAVQVFFGSLPVIGKVVLQVLPPIGLVGFRVGISAIAFSVVQTYRGRFWLKEKGDYGRLALLSVFGVTLNQTLFISGLSLTTAANTSLLAATIPIFTLAVSSFLGAERLRRAKIIGVLLAFAGVLVLIDPQKASFSSASTIGDLLIIANSLSYGIYVASSKSVITRNGAFRSITWVFIFAAIVCVPLGLFSMRNVDVQNVTSMVWLLVLYIGLGATASPYLLNAWALARLSPSTVAIFVYLQPLIGFLLAVAFLGELIDIKFALAASLVFVGVFLTSRRYTDSET